MAIYYIQGTLDIFPELKTNDNGVKIITSEIQDLLANKHILFQLVKKQLNPWGTNSEEDIASVIVFHMFYDFIDHIDTDSLIDLIKQTNTPWLMIEEINDNTYWIYPWTKINLGKKLSVYIDDLIQISDVYTSMLRECKNQYLKGNLIKID